MSSTTRLRCNDGPGQTHWSSCACEEARIRAEARMAALEEAAMVCDKDAEDFDRAGWSGDELMAKGCRSSAALIRDLATKDTP